MAYAKTAAVVAGDTTALAAQYNSIMAEMKAAAEGIPTHDVDIAIAYTGFKINTITLTDNSPAGDAGFDITAVGTYAYTGFKVTSIAWVSLKSGQKSQTPSRSSVEGASSAF